MGEKKAPLRFKCCQFFLNGVVLYAKYPTKQKQCPRKPRRTKQQPRSLKHFLLETANLFAQTCIPAISATFSLSFNIFTTTTFSTTINRRLLKPWNIRSASSNPAEVWLATAESALATFSLLSTMRVFGGWALFIAFLNKYMFVLLCFRWPQAKPNLCWDVQTSSAARSREYYWIEV